MNNFEERKTGVRSLSYATSAQPPALPVASLASSAFQMVACVL